MLSDNPSSYPSLTSNWTPMSSCVTSTGFWFVVYESHALFSNMFGMPSVTNNGQGRTPIGGCVPPSYTLSVPYITDGGCPTNYFRACSTGTSYAGQSADYIWCCPSVQGWNFNCAPATDTGAAPYGCQATFASGDTIMGSRTDLVEHTGQAETHTVRDDRGVNAWGIAILSTSPPSTLTIPAMTTTSSPGLTISATVGTNTNTDPDSPHTSPSQGLSPGAAAGVGTGVGVAALAILGVLIFWLLRRKYKAKQEHQRQEQQQQQPLPQSYQNSFYDGSSFGQQGPNFYALTLTKHNSIAPSTEMPALGVPFELSPHSRHGNPQEMQG
ncbi:hypothetical protein F5B22DRAFT_617601 [Xylaria bambusicola]|uniref:uncharacterized protein n=1 Tax=Xylaria bambusicola TaxID=326684 RepID=UPI002007FAE3|nr:uncharacterized protein F5B22DRAFT_617601 [Xylaria bambusicola]KAI0509295.1 hypothetical protein F5B22DRAFT_617601 [Xylaria bambusicola]